MTDLTEMLSTEVRAKLAAQVLAEVFRPVPPLFYSGHAEPPERSRLELISMYGAGVVPPPFPTVKATDERGTA